MLIDLEPLFPFEEKTEKHTVSFEAPDFDGHEVLEAPAFELLVMHRKGRQFSFIGEGRIVLSLPCDRCLKPVRTEVPFTIERDCDLETALDADGDPVSFLQEHTLDADRLIADEVLMNLPMKILCKEDCKGICHRCGADLNLGSCNCDNEAPTAMAEALMKALADAGRKQ